MAALWEAPVLRASGASTRHMAHFEWRDARHLLKTALNGRLNIGHMFRNGTRQPCREMSKEVCAAVAICVQRARHGSSFKVPAHGQSSDDLRVNRVCVAEQTSAIESLSDTCAWHLALARLARRCGPLRVHGLDTQLDPL